MPPSDRYDDRDRGRDTIGDVVRRETDGLRADIENLERLYASLSEKTSDNTYEVRRAKELLENMGARVGNLDKMIGRHITSMGDYRLIRAVVLGGASLILVAFLGYVLARWGLSDGVKFK